jgi:phosphatidylethanolamine-binding protein (PEBP) family uncharacterized protein
MLITWKSVSEPPEIKLNKSDSHLYTVILVDYDNDQPLFLHMLYYNVSGQEEGGDVIVKYTPPKPPAGQRHRYEILVFDQLGKRKIAETMRNGPGFRLEMLGLREEEAIARKMCESDGNKLYNCNKIL